MTTGKTKPSRKKFEIKPVSACTKEDDALSITEFPDEIFCWACQMPPYQQGTHRTLSGLWNGDTLLQRSHILAKSLNGEDKPENYFLLCPQCHAESPDTTDAKLFFAWVRYKRTHENYSMVLRRDMKKGGGDSGSGPEPCGGAICRAAADPAGRGCVYSRLYCSRFTK